MSDPVISSVRNPRVQEAARLRDRRHRARQGRIFIDGVREISRAADAGVRIVEAFVCPTLWRDEPTRDLVGRIERSGATVTHVTPHVYEKLAFGERAEGLLCVAQTPRTTLDDLVLPTNPLVAVVEGCEKPGNLGAVIRSADGAGLSAVLVGDTRVDLFNPNAIRASLGTIFSMPLAAAPSGQIKDWLADRGMRLFAARVDGSIDYTAADFTGPTAIVLGSEVAGLSDAWRDRQVTAIRLPMRGVADSLNVSAAAAALFYEAQRQRQPRPQGQSASEGL
ncbi:MAG: RNA methyltransferase [Planctomycetia bacterium]|nr:RNA methyltransferase [Planctomycetia bacterium]